MKLPPLSNRLKACYDYINTGDRVADIGCDHGYLGIRLLLSGKASSVIAADINQGPLDNALRNAHKYGISDKMSFYLSDGAQSIPKDFDTMVCAGMGADTIISILNTAPWLKNERYRLILQCQSRRAELRQYLYENGYCIHTEALAKDGKFIYPIMEVLYAPTSPLTAAQYHISPALIRGNSPLLPLFYDRVVDGIRTTVKGLSHNGGDKHEHYSAILQELLEMEELIDGNCR